MSNVAIVTVIPHLKDHFDYENIELLSRLMITMPSIMIALLAPFLGHIIHKIGKKVSAVFSLVLFGVAGSAGLYLNSMESLLASRALLGIAIAALMIVSTSLVGDYFSGEKRHKYMGIQSAFISFGGVLFVVGGGVLSDVDWRLSFAIYLIGFLLLPFVIKYLIEFKVDDNFLTSEEDLNPNLFKIYFLAFLLMVIFYVLPTQMPFLMINHFGASGTLTGAIISLAFVFHGLGALSFARLKKRFEFRRIYLIGMGIIGLGFIFVGLIENIYLFFLTAPILGFGGGLMMTNVSAWMLSLAHHTKRVKSSGYLTSSLFMGQFFSPIATMPIVAYFGVQDFFMVFGITLFVGIGLALLVSSYRS
jgi:MFS family permease